jgi:3-hydroxyisobutyrate dehydrogenase
MGFPTAGHLAIKGGHDVTVFNRTPAKAEAWVSQFGGRAAPTPRAAAQGQDFVMACVGNDHDLRSITIGGDGAFSAMKSGVIFVDHTTASAEVARELDAEATKLGFKFVDAPVSGGQARAENGALTVMCRGSEDAYARAEPVIAAYAKMCKRLGAPVGQLTKMVNQICIAGWRGVSGRIHFAKRAEETDVSAVMENRHKR